METLHRGEPLGTWHTWLCRLRRRNTFTSAIRSMLSYPTFYHILQYHILSMLGIGSTYEPRSKECCWCCQQIKGAWRCMKPCKLIGPRQKRQRLHKQSERERAIFLKGLNFNCQYQLFTSQFDTKLLHPLHVGQFVSVIFCLPFAPENNDWGWSLALQASCQSIRSMDCQGWWGIKCSPHIPETRDDHKALAFQ